MLLRSPEPCDQSRRQGDLHCISVPCRRSRRCADACGSQSPPETCSPALTFEASSLAASVSLISATRIWPIPLKAVRLLMMLLASDLPQQVLRHGCVRIDTDRRFKLLEEIIISLADAAIKVRLFHLVLQHAQLRNFLQPLHAGSDNALVLLDPVFSIALGPSLRGRVVLRALVKSRISATADNFSFRSSARCAAQSAYRLIAAWPHKPCHLPE